MKWRIFRIETRSIRHPILLPDEEVRAHPGRERGQSRISHATVGNLGNLGLKVSQVILETGSLRSPAVCRRAGLFRGDLSWDFSPQTEQVIWRQSASLWAWLGHAPQRRFPRRTHCPTGLSSASRYEQQLTRAT